MSISDKDIVSAFQLHGLGLPLPDILESRSILTIRSIDNTYMRSQEPSLARKVVFRWDSLHIDSGALVVTLASTSGIARCLGIPPMS